jgi:predicted P-loop ATPase
MWCIELSELNSIPNRELEKVKAFFSRKVDHYRPPYGYLPVDVPRQCIFIGTTNKEDYLKDETGNRRFLPVKCGEVIDIKGLKRDKDQLFAEAVVRYRAGERWWFDDKELVREAEQQQTERLEADPWDDQIAAYVKTGKRESVSVTDVLAYIGMDEKDWNRSHEMRVARSLKKLGWEKFRAPADKNDESGHRPWLYKPRCPNPSKESQP